MSGNGAKEYWSLDKKIPIVLVLTLLGQTGGIVWWVSSLNSRVTVVEEKALVSRLDIDKLKDGNAEARERFARAEESMKAFADTAHRIETKLDRLWDDKQSSKGNGGALIIRLSPPRSRKAGVSSESNIYQKNALFIFLL